MKRIHLKAVELINRCRWIPRQALSVEKSDLVDGLYIDASLPQFVVARLNYKMANGVAYFKHSLIPLSNVAGMDIDNDQIPEHQPLGTPPERDTKSGRRKPRTVESAKDVLAERAEARKQAKVEAKVPDSGPGECPE